MSRIWLAPLVAASMVVGCGDGGSGDGTGSDENDGSMNAMSDGGGGGAAAGGVLCGGDLTCAMPAQMCCWETDSTTGEALGTGHCDAFPDDPYNSCSDSTSMTYRCSADVPCPGNQECCTSAGAGSFCSDACNDSIYRACSDQSDCTLPGRTCREWADNYGPPGLTFCFD